MYNMFSSSSCTVQRCCDAFMPAHIRGIELDGQVFRGKKTVKGKRKRQYGEKRQRDTEGEERKRRGK